jgi:hypothetical protein
MVLARRGSDSGTHTRFLHCSRPLSSTKQSLRDTAIFLVVDKDRCCLVDDKGRLQWRNRVWVPESEPLRTGIVQIAHLSLQTGHPGREVPTELAVSYEASYIVAHLWPVPFSSDYPVGFFSSRNGGTEDTATYVLCQCLAVRGNTSL